MQDEKTVNMRRRNLALFAAFLEKNASLDWAEPRAYADAKDFPVALMGAL